MKVVFYILTLVATLVGLYFSNDLKGKLEDQIQLREETENRNRTVSANADKTEKELKTEEENLLAAQSDRAMVVASIDKLESEQRQYQRELDSVMSTVKSQKDKIQAALDQFEQVKERVGLQGDADVEDITATITDLEDQKKELDQEIMELDTVIEGARQAVEANRNELSRLASRKADRDAQFRRGALSSVITAVDQNWGFVVIGAGSNSGFTPEMKLIVQRDGRRIAEVDPSSVEASQTIAEIDFETMMPGVMIQPGDRVLSAKGN